MTSRFYWLGNRRDFTPTVVERAQPARRMSRAAFSGWLLLGALTLFFSAWFAYRWFTRPPWLALLPPILVELFDLGEAAGAFTLAFVWVGLWWRGQRRNTPPGPVQALDVDRLYSLNPKAFEKYVATLFQAKGYRVIWRGRSGDHGVDLELFGSGGRRGIVQCKRYQHTVGEDIVRELFGTLIHERASHAFLVTTAEVSDAAREWAAGKPMTLIDGGTLVQIATALHGRIPPGGQPRAG
ncbi:MAG: restriction endonuclease [Chloroflexi bacterium]|nr:restriction endonuclease [Chloroflexota bacterium]MCI0577520.1 restriction endonuclease [Chloroflexota bacterium]MCI0645641.1 restriction endonuclease [Chloroflexota bacterium]MCI0725553.1 restriction endonuclease [Chloroflexota bacterium]